MMWCSLTGPMLAEYYGLSFDEEAGTIVTVPQLLDNHIPDLLHLPDLLFRLCTDVDWTSEKVRLRQQHSEHGMWDIHILFFKLIFITRTFMYVVLLPGRVTCFGLHLFPDARERRTPAMAAAKRHLSRLQSPCESTRAFHGGSKMRGEIGKVISHFRKMLA